MTTILMTVAADSILRSTKKYRLPVRNFAGFVKKKDAAGKLVDAGYTVRVAQFRPKGPALKKGDLVRVCTNAVDERQWERAGKSGVEKRAETIGGGVKLLWRKQGKHQPMVQPPIRR